MKKKVGLVKTPETVSAVLKLATPETVSGVLEDYSGLDAAASTAKWAELDGAVDDSINAIHGNFVELAARLILVRSFLSQRGDPVRKAMLDNMVGFDPDMTWTPYLENVAARVNLSTRTLQDKIAGLVLGLPDGKNGSTVARDKRKKQIATKAEIQAQARIEFGEDADAGDVQAAAILTDYESAAGVSTTEIEVSDESGDTNWHVEFSALLDGVLAGGIEAETAITRANAVAKLHPLGTTEEEETEVVHAGRNAAHRLRLQMEANAETKVAHLVEPTSDTPDEMALNVVKRLEHMDKLGTLIDILGLEVA